MRSLLPSAGWRMRPTALRLHSIDGNVDHEQRGLLSLARPRAGACENVSVSPVLADQHEQNKEILPVCSSVRGCPRDATASTVGLIVVTTERGTTRRRPRAAPLLQRATAASNGGNEHHRDDSGTVRGPWRTGAARRRVRGQVQGLDVNPPRVRFSLARLRGSEARGRTTQ